MGATTDLGRQGPRADNGSPADVPSRRALQHGTADGLAGVQSIRARFTALHVRLVAGDVTAADDLCTLLAPELRRQVRPRDSRVPPEAIEDAIDDTLVLLVRDPARYQPARGDPLAWLVTIARNKLKDLERGARRRWRREVPLGDEIACGLQSPVRRPDELVEAREWIALHCRQLMATAKTAPERRFLLVRARCAPIPDQAAALGAADLPERQQRTLISRVWHRLRQRLIRS